MYEIAPQNHTDIRVGWAVAFSPDGHTVASGSNDRAAMGCAKWHLSQNLTGHGLDYVHCQPDGQTLASGSGDKTIKLWNATETAPHT